MREFRLSPRYSVTEFRRSFQLRCVPETNVKNLFDKLTLDRRTLLLAAAASAFAPIARAANTQATPAVAQDVALLGAPDTTLEAKIAALAQEAGLPRIGFAAVDVVRGRTAFVRGGELFPMQGIYTLPIAAAYLRMVQYYGAHLETKTRLTSADISPGRSPMAARLRSKPTTFTAQQLMEHMLLNADTTATDALLKVAGGPKTIQATIKDFAIDGLRVDRYQREMQPQSLGLEPSAAFADTAALDKAFDALGEAKQKEALVKFLRDQRDTASPRAIATLFVKIASSQFIQPRYAMMLFDLMRRSKVAEDRLKAGLPKDWTFSHIGAASRAVQGVTAAFHDAGIAQHKKDGRIVMVLFVEGATLSPAELAQFHRATAHAVIDAWS